MRGVMRELGVPFPVSSIRLQIAPTVDVSDGLSVHRFFFRMGEGGGMRCTDRGVEGRADFRLIFAERDMWYIGAALCRNLSVAH